MATKGERLADYEVVENILKVGGYEIIAKKGDILTEVEYPNDIGYMSVLVKDDGTFICEVGSQMAMKHCQKIRKKVW